MLLCYYRGKQFLRRGFGEVMKISGVISMREGLFAEYSRLDDDRLLSYVAAKEEAAFYQLYQNTARAVYGYILSFLKNPQDAEEVMQETYLKVWTMAETYEPQGKPLAWMFTIARNLCYMRFRQQKNQADISIYDLQESEPGEPCREIEQAPEKLLLLAALEQLKEEDRRIVLLHEAGGMKHREIAECLKMPLATVLSKHNRAIKKLTRFMTAV